MYYKFHTVSFSPNGQLKCQLYSPTNIDISLVIGTVDRIYIMQIADISQEYSAQILSQSFPVHCTVRTLL